MIREGSWRKKTILESTLVACSGGSRKKVLLSEGDEKFLMRDAAAITTEMAILVFMGDMIFSFADVVLNYDLFIIKVLNYF